MWGRALPAPTFRETPITCPNCGSGGAAMDKVTNRVYGWHDACGWQASLRVVISQGRAVLEPWPD